jgi:hypothetical protein
MALSQAKRRKVEKAVAADRKLAGGRVVMVHEYASGRAQGDQVVVGVHDPDGGSLVALVDAVKGKVVSVERTPAQFQLSEEERAEAEKLAVADSRSRGFVGRRRPNPLTRLYFPPGRDRSHRYAIVFLRPSNTERAYAVVDLTDGRVTDVLDRRRLTG